MAKTDAYFSLASVVGIENQVKSQSYEFSWFGKLSTQPSLSLFPPVWQCTKFNKYL